MSSRDNLWSGNAKVNPIPLCVDLDGTLLATDSLWEGLMVLLVKDPLSVLRTLAHMMKGRAHFKMEVAKQSSIADHSLPLNQDVLDFISTEANSGRKIILVTGAPESVAHATAKRAGIVADVFATNDELGNLTSTRKALFLRNRFGEKGFDYIGDSSKDIAVWREANIALCADVSKSTKKAAKQSGITLNHISQRKVSLNDWRKQLRMHQGLKNILVLLPLLLAHQILDAPAIVSAFLALVAFSLVSFGSYIWNDLHDLETDRNHPTKRHRPLAAGRISIPSALAASCLLVAAGFGMSAIVNPLLVLSLLTYLVVTVSYSAFFKSIVVADVILLAGLYTLRIVSGAVAISVALSIWVLLTSIFLFFSLALMKRLSEFVKYHEEVIGGRGYRSTDKTVILSTGVASGLLAVLVVGLYVNSDTVVELYASPQFLWGLLPLLLFWITRLWFLTERGQMDDDPVAFAVTDRVSQAVALIAVALAALATVVRF